MKNKSNHIHKPIEMLPSPQELAEQMKTERTTILLTKSTLEFFRDVAAKEGVSYTALIRQTLDSYVNSQHTR